MTRCCAMPHALVGLLARMLLATVLGFASLAAQAYAGPGALHARYGELREQLRHNSFQREMYVDSAEDGDALKGDVYAVLDHPFDTVSNALRDPRDWCDILLLPFNTKQCRAVEGQGGAMLHVRIGRKYDQPVQDAFRVEFGLRPVAATPEYFESRLDAANGPLGTRDYRIVVAAVPLDAKHTFMHLSYSYLYGMAGRLAMQAYLATAGADKVGIHRHWTRRDRPPGLHRGRARRDRAHRDALLPGDRRAIWLRSPRRPISGWNNGCSSGSPRDERYPRQLHEMDRGTYLALKRSEYGRPQAKAE